MYKNTVQTISPVYQRESGLMDRAFLCVWQKSLTEKKINKIKLSNEKDGGSTESMDKSQTGGGERHTIKEPKRGGNAIFRSALLLPSFIMEILLLNRM